MKMLKTLTMATAAALAGMSLAAHAQTQSQMQAQTQASAGAATATATATAADMAEAEVRRVDKANKKITLKHGPIKNLDMPPMTMVFNVNDAAMLDKVQAGDKVRFSATGDGGRYTVTDLQPAK